MFVEYRENKKGWIRQNKKYNTLNKKQIYVSKYYFYDNCPYSLYYSGMDRAIYQKTKNLDNLNFR